MPNKMLTIKEVHEQMKLIGALSNWTALNMALRNATEQFCHALFDWEKRDKKRLRWLLRIHSRLNYLRAQRERKELMKEFR